MKVSKTQINMRIIDVSVVTDIEPMMVAGE